MTLTLLFRTLLSHPAPYLWLIPGLSSLFSFLSGSIALFPLARLLFHPVPLSLLFPALFLHSFFSPSSIYAVYLKSMCNYGAING